jgi:hypothetical protein
MEFEGGEDVKVAVVDDLVILFCPLVFLLSCRAFLSLEVKVEVKLFHEFGAVLEIEVCDDVEVVVDDLVILFCPLVFLLKTVKLLRL